MPALSWIEVLAVVTAVASAQAAKLEVKTAKQQEQESKSADFISNLNL
jgi:hypothetical protein